MALSPAFATTTAASKAQMLADWQRAKEYTKEYLDAMPEDGYAFQPTPEIRSFAGQMLHIAGANYFFTSTALGTKNPYEGQDLEKMDNLKSKEAVTKFVMDSYDHVINAINGMTDEQLAKTVTMFKFEMPAEQLLTKAHEHQTHHRGQSTVYLRMKGVTPPQEKLF
nr:DinB family protein [Cesiribacter sp. SM1]